MEVNNVLNMLYAPEYALHRFAGKLEVELDNLYRNGVDRLIDLFDSLHQLVDIKENSFFIPLLNRNSVLGLYVRRILVVFDKLTFDQVVVLSKDLKRYIKKKIDSSKNSKVPAISKQEDFGMNK